ncbi:HAD-IIA family hydrolase [Fictibacillus sp. KIGAM418]|uniref:Acid sugar phosphatase n=1 Tax=Fictibacillus marinisediminis TaxID=2878389 RepID=A0A9X1XB28_9BACL|nr:HAD-IIA family hydrolase [Fictibacillus marinisediminis]MCK6257451.1 HAD-IIA family hydrolase [Fictibacillus marinisediminis]
MAKGFIFDLDGTVYVENQMIEGGKEAIEYLRNGGHKVVFFTNKSISTRHDYVKKLKGLGIEASIDEVINSNYITAKFLKQHMNRSDAVYVIGEEALFEELIHEGIRITEDPDQATYVVLGWDRQFNYRKLNDAYQAWAKNGAVILATNPDRTCPVVDGEIPDCGSIIGAMEGTIGKAIDYIMGKPSKFAADIVIKDVLHLKPEECYIIGDRLETDIRMGNDNGIQTVLVLSGITTKEMVKDSVQKPSYILQSIKDIHQLPLHRSLPITSH